MIPFETYLNCIRIPCDIDAQDNVISEDIDELHKYLSDLELLLIESKGVITSDRISRFVSPACVMAEMILLKALHQEKGGAS